MPSSPSRPFSAAPARADQPGTPSRPFSAFAGSGSRPAAAPSSSGGYTGAASGAPSQSQRGGLRPSSAPAHSYKGVRPASAVTFRATSPATVEEDIFEEEDEPDDSDVGESADGVVSLAEAGGAFPAQRSSGTAGDGGDDCTLGRRHHKLIRLKSATASGPIRRPTLNPDLAHIQ